MTDQADQTEARLRSALTNRAESIAVGEPKAGLKQRIAARRRHRRRRVAIASGAVAIVVAAVAFAPVLASSHHSGTKREQAAPARPATLASQLVRDTHPAVPASAVTALTQADTATAIDLYHQLAQTPGNVFFSPYSISTALTMAAAGARGTTLSQMLTTMHNTLPPAELQDATNALNLALLRNRPLPFGTKGQPLQLEVANSLWGQAGYHIESAFLDLLARDYGAPLNTVDFERNPAGATKAINAWVDAHTNHMIPNLLSLLRVETRLVLVNAVYFKGSWAQPFLPSATSNGPFTTAAGPTVTAPFMNGVFDTRYAAGTGWQAVDLPYLGNASMTLVVPDAGHFAQFERGLDAGTLAHIVGSLTDANVTLAMPKFELDDTSGLAPMLQSLGMHDAFGDAADFSGITGNRDLHIAAVAHEAKVKVDETGTVAAAATAVVGETLSLRLVRSVSLTIDRPYLVLIRDDHTGAILFMGRVTDPTQTQAEQP